MGLNPLLDSDHIVYVASAVADAQAKEKYGKDDYLHHDYKAWALSNAKQRVEMILEHFPDRKYTRLFLGGPHNYRKQIGKIKPYKGQRSQEKPKYFQEVREYLMLHHNAELSHWREADDEVSILQWEAKDKSTCIVSTDKDLGNTPGNHLRWKKAKNAYEFLYVTKREADLNFWQQVATGDSSDNIQGLKGVGPKTVEKAVQSCNSDLGKFRKWLDQEYKKCYGSNWQEALWETATLVWIQRDSWINWDGSKITYNEESKDGEAHQERQEGSEESGCGEEDRSGQARPAASEEGSDEGH